MPNLVTLKVNAPVRTMGGGALDLLTRTTNFDHENIRLDRVRRKPH